MLPTCQAASPYPPDPLQVPRSLPPPFYSTIPLSAGAPKLEQVSESPEGLVKHALLGLTPVSHPGNTLRESLP